MHVILVGFKHTGKTTLGSALALRLGLPFVDLDDALEMRYESLYNKRSTAREIMAAHGEEKFREIEYHVLCETLKKVPQHIIALGGGTPMAVPSQEIILGHTIVHVTADPEVVYRRLLANSMPSFISSEKEFRDLWALRMPVYQSLANITIAGNKQFDETVLAPLISYLESRS